ncbi:MAG: glycosyltransferase family 87 protein [Polyangiaceae bacterium]
MAPPSERWLERFLTRERVRRFSIAILAVNLVLYAAVVARGRFPFDAQGTIILPDFMAHLTGGALLAQGRARELYDVAAQSAFQLGITHDAKIIDVFLSPPLTACLYAPFALLPYSWATVAWTAVSLGLLVLSGGALRRLTPSVARDDRVVFFVALAASQPVIQLLGSGQDTAISLLLWTFGTHFALGRRDASAGATFALGLFKPQLFLLPPLVFLALRRWRAVAAWAAASAALGAITLFVFGVDGVRGWLRILASPEYLVSLRAGRALRMASLAPLLLSIAPDSLVSVADVAGKVLCAALVVATMGRSVATRAGRAVDERGVWALACVATLLVTPHLFYYDLALLALPAALLLEISGTYSHASRVALLALTLLTWTGAARIPFESAAWPVRLLAASWTAIPMFFLWREIPTRRSEPVSA